MGLLVSLILRVTVLAFSFFTATGAAALLLTFVLFLGRDVSWLERDPLAAGGAFVFFVLTWLQTAQLSLVPALIVLLGLEIMRLTSLTAGLLAGGLCAALVLLIPVAGISFDSELPYRPNEIYLSVIAAGFVAGLVHWLIAGHRSGKWLASSRLGEKDLHRDN